MFLSASFFVVPALTSETVQAAKPSPYRWIKYSTQVGGPSAAWEKGGFLCGCLLYIDSKYRLYYTGDNSTGYPQIGISFSNTTLSWTNYASNPILANGSGSDWDSCGAGYPCVVKDGSQYKMWYAGSNGSAWNIGYATSTDGINWTKYSQNPVMTTGATGSWEGTDLQSPYVVIDGSGYRMWYAGYNQSMGSIGYATSADGLCWTRYSGNPVIVPNTVRSGVFDYKSVFAPCVLNISDEYRIWYTGYDGYRMNIGYGNSSDGTKWKLLNSGNLGLLANQLYGWEEYANGYSAVVFNGSAYLMLVSAGGQLTLAAQAEGWNTIPSTPKIDFPANDTLTDNGSFSLAWDFYDSDDGDAQLAYQVQVDDNASFSSVDYDTGMVASDWITHTFEDAVADGTWYYRCRVWDTEGDFSLWSKMMKIRIDSTPPINPASVNSTTHKVAEWSRETKITVQWSGAVDAVSGVGGYSVLWDAFCDSLPDGTWDLPGTTLQNTSPPLPDGRAYYFHIRAVDKLGNAAADACHLGPFRIDATPPVNPGVGSSTHHIGVWSNLSRVTVNWDNATDGMSQVAGYSYLWDTENGTVPDKAAECAAGTTCDTSNGLAEGSWHFHIRTVDNAGNWADYAEHLGPFDIDYSPPWNPLNVTSPTHVPGVWSNRDRLQVEWSEAGDDHSDIGACSYSWDDCSTTVPDEAEDCRGDVSTATSPPLPDGTNHFFHIRVRDSAGNWNGTAVHNGPFWIDTTPPDNPSGLGSPSHTPALWSTVETVLADWLKPQVGGNGSGVAGYSIAWNQNATHLPDLSVDLGPEVTSASSNTLGSGVPHYFHIRSCDLAGNWAPVAGHLGPFLIDTIPPGNPVQLGSDDHAILEWSASNVVTARWTAGSDGQSGLAGYGILWDRQPGTLPPEDNNAGPDDNSTRSPPLEDGSSWYLHVRSVDTAGNWATGASHLGPFQIDTTAPVITGFSANSGARFTTSATVLLALNASDGPAGAGLASMRFFCDGCWTAWENYSQYRPMTLKPGDGPRALKAEVMDAVNQSSGKAEARIILDTRPPELRSLLIENGSGMTNSSVVGVAVVSTDSAEGSGVSWMALEIDGTGWGEWRPYAENFTCDIGATAGDHRLSVKVRDGIGFESQALSCGILLDNLHPEIGRFRLNGGSGVGNSLSVDFDLAVTDPKPSSGMGMMSFSEDGTAWSGWMPYTGRGNFSLSPGEGNRALFVRARDNASNVAQYSTARVTIDTRGPQVVGHCVTSIRDGNATIRVELDEDARVVLSYGISETDKAVPSGNYAKVHFLNLSNLSNGTTYHFSTVATDRLGNPSPRADGSDITVPAAPRPPARAPPEDSWPLKSYLSSPIVWAIILSVVSSIIVASATVAKVRRMGREAGERHTRGNGGGGK